MADLFWSVLGHLKSISPRFYSQGRNYCAMPRKFKRVINVIDSSTIQLVANCMDWAKHRRRKAAAKMHLRLDLRSFLPSFVVVKYDAKEARTVCAGVNPGEICVFDKASVDSKHLYELLIRGVFWVTRAKTNMKYEVMGQHSAPKGNILRDEVIKLTGVRTSQWYPKILRRIEAMVEVDGKMKKNDFHQQ